MTTTISQPQQAAIGEMERAARESIVEALAKGGLAAITCSFQAEDMVVLRLVQELQPDIPVLFLETG